MYKLGNTNIFKIDEQLCIPVDEANADYQAYQAWLAEGNTPELAEVPVIVPPKLVVSAWKIRKALNVLGLRQVVEDAIAASNDQDMKDAWEYATEFERDHELVLSLGTSLNKTSEELDQIFTLASTL